MAERVLALTTPLRLLAKAIGMAIARARGVEVDEEKAVALGLQWINAPRRYRTANLVDICAPPPAGSLRRDLSQRVA